MPDTSPSLPQPITRLIRRVMTPALSNAILDIMREQWQATQGEVQGPATDYRSYPRSSLGAMLADPTTNDTRARPPMGELTRTGGSQSASGISALGVYQPGNVTWEQMDLMEKHYLVRFCLNVRGIPLALIFRSDPGDNWDVKVADENEVVQEFVRAAVKRIMLRLVREAQTARAYGFYASEKVWKVATARELGLEGDRLYFVYDKIKGNHPQTVQLNWDDQDHFTGYTQKVPGQGALGEVIVPADKAFIFTHRKEFGNLYGKGLYESLFTPWWWLEFVWRALMRYMERMGTPVAVVYAPQGERVKDSDGTVRDAMDIALNLAIDVGRSNAVALPSDSYAADEGSGVKWRIEYLQDSGVAAQFDAVIERLETALIRAAQIPEKVLGQQSGGSGAYAAWRVPADFFEQTLEIDLAEFVEAVNSYLLPQLGLYNYGADYGEPGAIALTVAGIDSSDIERLVGLLPQVLAGNADAEFIDILEMLRQARVPVLSDEEIAEKKAEKAANLQKMQTAMKGKAPGGPNEETPEEGQEPPAPEGGTPEEAATPSVQADEGVFRSPPMTTSEFLRYAADRMVEADGAVTIMGRSQEEFTLKAQALAQAGVPRSYPVRFQWVNRDGTPQDVEVKEDDDQPTSSV